MEPHTLCNNEPTYDAEYIDPPHPVDASGHKVAAMVDAMRQLGWVGAPLVAVMVADTVQCLTGSHRIAAARIAGIAVPVHVADRAMVDAWIADNDIVDLWPDVLVRTDDDGRLAALREIGDQQAIRIMEHEVQVLGG